jgi:hypothetical protein
MSDANPNPIEKSMVLVLVVANKGGGVTVAPFYFFLLLNIYTEYHPDSHTYIIPHTLTPLTLLPRCIMTGDLNVYHVLWNSRVIIP